MPAEGTEAWLAVAWGQEKNHHSNRAAAFLQTAAVELGNLNTFLARLLTWRAKVGRKKLSSSFDAVFQIPRELLLNKVRLAFPFSKSFPQ